MVDMFLYSPLEVPVGGLLENPFLKDIKKCDVYEISNLCMEYCVMWYLKNIWMAVLKPKRSNTPKSTFSQNMALFLRYLFPYVSNQVYAPGVLTKNVMHEKSWHEYFMHENNISMHENAISLHGNEI